MDERRTGARPAAKRQGSAGNAAAQAAAERAEAEKHPGLMTRVASALILQDIVAKGHLIEERFSQVAVPSRLATLDGRDRALARSIVTAALRRLGTLRGAVARFLDKGLPKGVPELEWTLIVGAVSSVGTLRAISIVGRRVVRGDPEARGHRQAEGGLPPNLR